MSWGARQGDSEWYSPPTLVEAARTTMGGIDLDPASCAIAQTVVRASIWYDAQQDGLRQQWSGRVFLNPPWGIPKGNARYRGCSPKAEFVRKLVDHYRAAEVSQAVVVLGCDVTPRWFAPLGAALDACCLVRDRVYYYRTDPAIGVRANRGTFVAYLGPAVDRFRAAFGPMGLLLVPAGAAP